jgi:deoxyribonuclease-4
MEKYGFRPEYVLPHAGYLINIGNPDADKRKTSYDALVDELTRCSQLGLFSLNIHPGSHLGGVSEEECLRIIAEQINRALDETRGVSVVLENTAGQGTNMGYRFEQLATIIDYVEDKSRIGICLDTCHALGAGYEIRTPEGYESVMQELDRVVDLKYLRGMHLNDAKIDLGSRKDRHQSLGKGTLGLEPFRFIMNDPRLDEIPLILETIDEELWAEEIAMLYGMVEGGEG